MLFGLDAIPANMSNSGAKWVSPQVQFVDRNLVASTYYCERWK